MLIFLDDGLGGGANSIQAKINSLTVNADLLKFDSVLKGGCTTGSAFWFVVRSVFVY